MNIAYANLKPIILIQFRENGLVHLIILIVSNGDCRHSQQHLTESFTLSLIPTTYKITDQI